MKKLSRKRKLEMAISGIEDVLETAKFKSSQEKTHYVGFKQGLEAALFLFNHDRVPSWGEMIERSKVER